MNIVEGSLPPETGVYRGWRVLSVLIDKVIGRHVPDFTTLKMIDNNIRILGNQAPTGIFEIITVVEGSLIKNLLIGLAGSGRRRTVSGTVGCR